MTTWIAINVFCCPVHSGFWSFLPCFWSGFLKSRRCQLRLMFNVLRSSQLIFGFKVYVLDIVVRCSWRGPYVPRLKLTANFDEAVLSFHLSNVYATFCFLKFRYQSTLTLKLSNQVLWLKKWQGEHKNYGTIKGLDHFTFYSSKFQIFLSICKSIFFSVLWPADEVILA